MNSGGMNPKILITGTRPCSKSVLGPDSRQCSDPHKQTLSASPRPGMLSWMQFWPMLKLSVARPGVGGPRGVGHRTREDFLHGAFHNEHNPLLSSTVSSFRECQEHV